jgi:soluble lytic murein transglycosylase-like protein
MADGDNRAIFTAIDDAGNTTEIRIVVTYNKPQATTTTTKQATTTTKASSSTTNPPTTWSPLWPADAGGIRDVEAWRSLVAKYWSADRVDCVLGIIKKESRGDPRAYNSRSSAEGLMQHLSKYWKGRAAAAGFRDSNGLYASPYSAEANIAAGAHIAGSGADWYTPWGYHPAYGSCPDSRG